MEVRKRKRYSKHVKKNQRKFTNVKDVEQYLEEVRRDERTGGAFTDKPDEELFRIERGVGEEAVNAKGVRHGRLLRCETSVAESKIQGFKPIRRKPRINSKMGMDQGQPTPPHYHDSSEDEEYDFGTSFKQLVQQKTQLKKSAHSRTAKPRIKIASRDLWADDGSNEATCHLDNDNLYFETARLKPVKKPSSVGARPSALENVEVPHPGVSYNPTFEDHQELVRTAVDVEEDRLKEEDKLARKLKLASMTAQQREQVWLQEMSEGLFGDVTNSNGADKVEQEEGAEQPLPVLKRPVRAEDRKTHQQRRKERLRREEERRRRLEKLEKVRSQAIYSLRSVRKEMREKEEKMMENIRKRQQEKDKGVYSTKRLGRYSYQEPDLDVQLSTDIAQSLRALKPEGSIAVDRFKSLQKRNIIEPRERFKLKRKYKIKIKEKRSARLEEDKS